ncbi:uncharacterized protein ACOB7L_008780 [Callospermophilus lateralis]
MGPSRTRAGAQGPLPTGSTKVVLDPTQSGVPPHSPGTDNRRRRGLETQTRCRHCDLFIFPANPSRPDARTPVPIEVSHGAAERKYGAQEPGPPDSVTEKLRWSHRAPGQHRSLVDKHPHYGAPRQRPGHGAASAPQGPSALLARG